MTVTKQAAKFFGIIMASLLPLSLSVAAPLTNERQATLEHLLIQDCGSCHGLRMTGGLGPALTPQLLAEKPRENADTVWLNGLRAEHLLLALAIGAYHRQVTN